MFRDMNLSNDTVGVCGAGVATRGGVMATGGTSESGTLRERGGRPRTGRLRGDTVAMGRRVRLVGAGFRRGDDPRETGNLTPTPRGWLPRISVIVSAVLTLQGR